MTHKLWVYELKVLMFDHFFAWYLLGSWKCSIQEVHFDKINSRYHQRSCDLQVHLSGYAKAGEISGDPVYVNYARKEDFEHLEDEGIETKGHICFARYGQIFRGNKARFAEIAECAGLVLFSDSADYSPEWTEPYPATWFLPKTGAQRLG